MKEKSQMKESEIPLGQGHTSVIETIKLGESPMKKSKALAVSEPSVAQMLSGALASVQGTGVSLQDAEVLGKLMDLYERTEKRQSEKEFAAALTALQGDTIRVQATKAVDVKAGVPRYTFAPYEEIMRICQPILTRHGFSVTFDTKIDGDRLYSVCTLTHKAGHSRSNQFAVRFTTPPGSSSAQGDMSTKSYAKRGALCDALNISIEHDDDARMIGTPIGQALALDLEDRVRKVGADENAFLKYAGAKTYAEISDERYPALDELLTRKEAAKQ